MTTTTETKRREFSAYVGQRDFTVTVKRYAADGSYNAGQCWVEVSELVTGEGGRFWDKFLFSYNVDADLDDFGAAREAFHQLRQSLKGRVRSWNNYREWARMEKGGKRGYYTKCANETKPRLMQAAEHWKIAKAIWKQITKL
jgi:hypothetical protein